MSAYKRISPQPVIEGGTGIKTATTYAPLCGGTTTTGALQQATTGFGTSGYVLTSTGSSSLPTWQASGSSNKGNNNSFRAYLGTTVSGVIGTGSGGGYYLGTTQVLTIDFDNTGGNVYIGSGSGVAASFTAPASGYYWLGVTGELGALVSQNVVASAYITVNGTLRKVFSNGAYSGSYTTGGPQQATIPTAEALTPLTAGDVVRFAFQCGSNASNNVNITGASAAISQTYVTCIYGWQVA